MLDLSHIPVIIPPKGSFRKNSKAIYHQMASLIIAIGALVYATIYSYYPNGVYVFPSTLSSTDLLIGVLVTTAILLYIFIAGSILSLTQGKYAISQNFVGREIVYIWGSYKQNKRQFYDWLALGIPLGDYMDDGVEMLVVGRVLPSMLPRWDAITQLFLIPKTMVDHRENKWNTVQKFPKMVQWKYGTILAQF